LKTKSETNTSAPLSEARQRLDDIIANRDGLIAYIKTLESQRERLAAIQNSEAPFVAELAKLADNESSAMSVWSRSGEGPAPVSDVARRATLNQKLAQARAGDEAARNAHVAVVAAIAVESQKIASAAAPTQNAIVDILIEECEPLIQRFMIDQAAVSALAMQIRGLSQVIGEGAHAMAVGDAQKTVFQKNVGFLERLAKVETRIKPDEAVLNEQRAEWSDLWNRLGADSSAKLEA
jgi:hypothetical protein